MKKSRFTEQQIAFALQQAETGTSVEEVCRKLGIGQAPRVGVASFTRNAVPSAPQSAMATRNEGG